MSRGHEQNYNTSNATSEATTSRFDAPRPAVTNRLGKKRTDELIRADGDTWQEYLAVSEKASASTSNRSKDSGVLSSLFGKKKKNKQSTNSESNTNNVADTNDNKKLIVRSYFQNLRTGRKVWDEPPSGASNIIPASEEMRRMAELQIGELYVSTTPPTGIEDFNNENKNDSSSNKNDRLKNSFFRKGNAKTSTNNSNGGNTTSTAARTSIGRRIRYKPDSSLNTTSSASDAGRSRISGETLNDQQLREAIERSMNESHGGTAVETEEEILQRVLETSRLEAEGPRPNNIDYDGNDRDRKLFARKYPPPNNASIQRR